MRFATVVPSMRSVSRLFRPFEDGQLRVTAVDHDPSNGPFALLATNLTSINRVNHRFPSASTLPIES